ncbi:MAG: alpha/beta fold hydrolase [Paracoccus sp. (in: a-proteobacteria)]|uniref:PHA/PHB synthase family protein n=1 Tax=Paracoccus sp. TaxID=267 RepID=UPI0026DF0175|nr:alpha/beta fold hydrolase [Paracoccus sp. (in: a-proteobacteria)]MDO5611774.1 alpha/beta fold hydrolase [Paracoccus sp. (in: a-proteobacteria)]
MTMQDSQQTPDPQQLFDDLDRLAMAALGRLTGGLSAPAFQAALADWITHLAMSPGKQMSLHWKAMRKARRLLAGLNDPMGTEGQRIEPLPQDRRFAAPEWQDMPFSAVWQSFLLTQQWWHNATTGVKGVSREHERIVEFASRQWLDMMSPSNFPWLNPVVLKRARDTHGQSLMDGYGFWLRDLVGLLTPNRGGPLPGFEPGQRVALTPGRVVLRTRMMELIQYAPATKQVHATPILLVPAWIMKYYILDLSPENSLIRWLVGQGFTVFCMSWRNPVEKDRDTGFDDYRQDVMAALDAVLTTTGAARAHGLGYCLGGTLLTVAAAAMARDGDDRLASMTVLAGQADFSEAGELTLLTTEAQVALLEAMMFERGYLDQRAMAGTFSMLRSQDLIWSRITREYLLGEREDPSDIAAWSKDTTRMPYRMHSEYLRRLFIGNDLSEGRFDAGGKPVFPADIQIPAFLVGTEHDHIAPWRSVWKLMYLLSGDVQFALASGGHNTGIVAAPSNPRAKYRLIGRKAGDLQPDPDAFIADTPKQPGSWWQAWADWLSALDPAMVAPPRMRGGKSAHDAAPGRYVHE